MKDKELAKTCTYFCTTPAMPEENPFCLAHLQEARVFDCYVWLGRGHITGDSLVDRCADFKAD